jgi:predicted glutamine amidotransferase
MGAVTSENSHPIRVDVASRNGPSTLLIAHNGTIREPLLATLRDDLREADSPASAHSDNDTVILSAWLALRATEAVNIFESLSDSLRELLQRAEQIADNQHNGDKTACYTAINLLIGHTDGLFALRQFSREADYYTLYCRSFTDREYPAGGYLVASERTDDSTTWQLLEPGVLTLFPNNAVDKVRKIQIAVS